MTALQEKEGGTQTQDGFWEACQPVPALVVKKVRKLPLKPR